MKVAEKIFNRLIEKPLYANLVLLGLFLAYRATLLILHAFPFNSDEAIVGLMARHILSGERPLFFYGQSYMGSLDAFLIALGFRLFTESVIVIRLIQSLLFFLTVITVYFFVIIAFHNQNIAFFSGIMLIFAPVNLVLYSTVSLGGYGEALLIGSLSLLVSALIIEKFGGSKKFKKSMYFFLSLLGGLTGLGLWTNALSLTFCVPATLAVFYYLVNDQFSQFKTRRLFGFATAFLTGIIVGSYFWWFSFISSDNISLFTELTGSAVAVERTSYLQQIWQHFLSFILFGPTVMFGLRPPWDVKIIMPYFAPVVVFFWGLVLVQMMRKWSKISKRYRLFFTILIGVGFIQFLGYVFTSFGVDPSGRYFLPFYIPLAIFAAYVLVTFKNSRLIATLFSMVILFNIIGVFTLARNPPYLTTQFYSPAQVNSAEMPALIKLLQQNGEFGGYSNYWVSYPLAFLSNEEIIAVPELPYHDDLRYTTRDNRIPSYNSKLANQDSVFYITTNNPSLDILIRQKLFEHQVQYQYHEVGDFHVFYNLSKKISPEQLGLYESYE